MNWLVWYAGQRGFTDIALVRRKVVKSLSQRWHPRSAMRPRGVRTGSDSLSVMAVYPYEPTSASLFASCDAWIVEPRNINH
jgi:hypothetical protein